MMEKKEIHLVDKMNHLVAKLKAREGITTSDVRYIAPQSGEMIALVTHINKTNTYI